MAQQMFYFAYGGENVYFEREETVQHNVHGIKSLAKVIDGLHEGSFSHSFRKHVSHQFEKTAFCDNFEEEKLISILKTDNLTFCTTKLMIGEFHPI